VNFGEVSVFSYAINKRIRLHKTHLAFIGSVRINEVPNRKDPHRTLLFNFELANVPIDDFTGFIKGFHDGPISDSFPFRVKPPSILHAIEKPFALDLCQLIGVLVF